MNESKLKAAAMDAVGELPDLGNLLLREFGYPHLPDPVFVPVPKAGAWNDAGTKPDHPCLCITTARDGTIFQYWNGEYFGFDSKDKNVALEFCSKKSSFQAVQWREVQA
jgi:hypothetical protein